MTRLYLKARLAMIDVHLRLLRAVWRCIERIRTTLSKWEAPERVFICSGCSRQIREGELYTDILGEQFCQGCVKANTLVAKLVVDRH